PIPPDGDFLLLKIHISPHEGQSFTVTRTSQRERCQNSFSKATLCGLHQPEQLIGTVNLLRPYFQSVNVDLVVLSNLLASLGHALRKGDWIEANDSQCNLFIKDR